MSKFGRIVPYPKPEGVPNECINTVILATVFKLEPGTENYSDKQKHILIKQFTYKVYNEELSR